MKPTVVTTIVPGPPRVFKYCRREHADLMRNQGLFRIGTLYEFRNTEIHGNEIGDDDEGRKEVFQNLNRPWEDTIARKTMVNSSISGPPLGGPFLRDVTIKHRHEVPDCFLYCVSHVREEKVMKAFGADTCLEIQDWRRFARALHDAVNRQHQCNRMDFAPCVYGPRIREFESDGEMHPAVLKAGHYSYQHEARIMFFPKALPIAPIFVRSMEAAACLR